MPRGGGTLGNVLIGSTTLFTGRRHLAALQRSNTRLPAPPATSWMCAKPTAATPQPPAFYVDGVQVELGQFTTYVDGDQDGCTVERHPHTSSSYRSDQARGRQRDCAGRHWDSS
jgi:hypothetical protein